MRLLYGWQRKVALVPLALFMLGWFIYAIGFIWMLVEWPEEEVNNNNHPSRDSSLNFPYYVCLVVAPLLYFFAVLFTVLPGVAGSVTGVLVSFLSTFYFVSASWIVYESGRRVAYIARNGYGVNLKLMFVFAGKALEDLCWSLMLLLSIFYKYKAPTPNHFVPIEETRESRLLLFFKSCFKRCHFKADTTNYVLRVCICVRCCIIKCQKREIPFTPGVARPVCVPFILFSAVGWCIFAVGFHRLFENMDSESSYPFSFSASLLIPPLLFLSALLHAAFPGGVGRVMGMIAALLHVPFVVFFGYVVVNMGQYLYNLCVDLDQDGPWEEQDWMCFNVEDWTTHTHRVYIFAGSITSLVFWSCVISMWPFYRSDRPRLEDLEHLMVNLRESSTVLDSELDTDQHQQQTPTYGSMQQIENFQGNSNTNSFSHQTGNEEQTLRQEDQQQTDHSLDRQYSDHNDQLHYPDDQSEFEQYQGQRDQCRDEQYHSDQCQGNQYQSDQYQGDQYQSDQCQHREDQYQDNQSQGDQGDQCQHDHTNEAQQQHQTVHNDSEPLIRAERASSV